MLLRRYKNYNPVSVLLLHIPLVTQDIEKSTSIVHFNDSLVYRTLPVLLACPSLWLTR